jgi:hypothetical protein
MEVFVSVTGYSSSWPQAQTDVERLKGLVSQLPRFKDTINPRKFPIDFAKKTHDILCLAFSSTREEILINRRPTSLKGNDPERWTYSVIAVLLGKDGKCRLCLPEEQANLVSELPEVDPIRVVAWFK